MVPRNSQISRAWIFLFFFVSGATGLIYEVVWTRLLTLIMGNTHYSIATVLTAFMGGLALGSFFGGKIIDRAFNPLAAYAILGSIWSLRASRWVFKRALKSYRSASS